MLKLTPGRLRYWERLGLVTPYKEDGEVRYRWDQLVRLRALDKLVAQGARAKTLAELDLLLTKERLECHGNKLVRYHEGQGEELQTGQLVLDFSESSEEAIRLPVRRNWLQLAREARQKGHLEDSLEAAYRAIEQNPVELEAHNLAGMNLLDLDRPGDAVPIFEDALELAPQSIAIRFNLANALDDCELLDEARVQLERVSSIEPNFKDAVFNLGLVLEKLGQQNQAYRQWRRYLELDPAGPVADQVRELIEDRHLTGQVIPLHRGS